MKRPKGPMSKRVDVIVACFKSSVWRWHRRRFVGLSLPYVTECGRGCRCLSCVHLEGEFWAMKNPTAEKNANDDGGAPWECPEILKKLKGVGDLLCNPSCDDGVSKGERTMWVGFSGPIVKVLVTLKGLKLKAMVTGRSLDEALAAWEALLKSDQVPWEQYTEDYGRGQKKK